MPDPEVLRRPERRGVRIHWTGRDGAVLEGLGPELGMRRWGDAADLNRADRSAR